ncbi:MAG TPA: sugar transferase [Planctomycetaceae bacterium]|nr:sugar transferase [Planctomycetaceae bacterium]
MTASVLDEPRVPGADLADIFDHYLADESLTPPPWLTRLNLGRPRRNTRCLGESMRVWKRLMDVVGALFLLIALSPVMLVVAVLIRLTSPGPVIFRQVRVGLNLREKKRDRRLPRLGTEPPAGIERRQPQTDRRRDSAYGKPFVLYKFRTMRIDAEKNGAQLATKGDPRVTSIGRFLRLTRLDELPQLWNVLKGEMTLVGPRPERPEFIEQLSGEIPNYLNRLGLKPGLTGLAQIVNGYDSDLDSFRRKVNFDLMYLQNCCVWNDLKILFRTIGVVLTGSGAR